MLKYLVCAFFFILAFVAMFLFLFVFDGIRDLFSIVIIVACAFSIWGWVIDLGDKVFTKMKNAEQARKPVEKVENRVYTKEEIDAKWDKIFKENAKWDKIGCLIWIGIVIGGMILGYMLNR